MKRRTFLKMMGMGSLSFVSGCGPESEKRPFRPERESRPPEKEKRVVYASTCRECPAGCGILAKSQNGRVYKVEGNPLHPINRGKLCLRGQAALQGVYHPDRLTVPLVRDNGILQPSTFARAEKILKDKIADLKGGKNQIRMITEAVGASQYDLFKEVLKRHNCPEPVVFEPFAYESLKKANEIVFGQPGLPSYRMARADFLLSFGADFLETWLSPVEYARKYNDMRMHGIGNGGKGLFYHVGPYRSITGANADRWLACHPGGEAFIALWLIHVLNESGRKHPLTGPLHQRILDSASCQSLETTARLSGVSEELLDELAVSLLNAQKPLIIGTGSGAMGPNSVETNILSNYLNFVLDPELSLLDFEQRHRVESAAGTVDMFRFFHQDVAEQANILILNQVNPVYCLPPDSGIREILQEKDLFVVCFSYFRDETSGLADLVIPTRMPMEAWDEYGGHTGIVSTLQPVMESLNQAPAVGDVMLNTLPGKDRFAADDKAHLVSYLSRKHRIKTDKKWRETIRQGGFFNSAFKKRTGKRFKAPTRLTTGEPWFMNPLKEPLQGKLMLIATPSMRHFDGRSTNRPWLWEARDVLTGHFWQTPVLIHPETAMQVGLKPKERIRIKCGAIRMETGFLETSRVIPGAVAMGMGQGHTEFGQYADNMGSNPVQFFTSPGFNDTGPSYFAEGVEIQKTGRFIENPNPGRIRASREIQPSFFLSAITREEKHGGKGKPQIDERGTVPPNIEGYDDRNTGHSRPHRKHRWAMSIDLDRCIGCGACVVACYAENNIGIAGPEQADMDRDLAWIRLEYYSDLNISGRGVFVPMLCQHCDQAPCEVVCPVFASRRSPEGLNEQSYERCIGARYCARSCPYHVRRFNWSEVKWPDPLQLQLNPDVPARSKGVMEKCTFCVQRIKQAREKAEDEQRGIRDGEVLTACMQTCPTEAIIFGDILDAGSLIRKRIMDHRAFQLLGGLNTKPGIIYLKKLKRPIG